MNKKNLLVGINSKFVHTNLAIRYIKSYVEEYSSEKIELYEANINGHLIDIIREIYEKNPSMLIFSTYIWNKEMVFKIVDEIKKILPNCEIALGGPEVSYNPREVLKKYDSIDYIIEGEERPVLDLLTLEIEKTKGIYYRKENEIGYNGVSELIRNLDEIPFPYTREDLEENKGKILYYESSRGCPYSCSYCMSSIEKRVRNFSIERVKRDLKVFLDLELSLLKFVDRTFNLNKNFYMEIWEFLKENYNGKTTFHFEISADIFDEEALIFLESLPKDYFQFEVGVQTTNPKTMEIIKRKSNLEKLEENVLRIKDNIHLHLDLIAGLPEEDYDSFKNSFNYVHKLRPEMIQLGFLKILKGTEMNLVKDKYKIKHVAFPPYEVLSTDKISFEELLKLKDFEHLLDYYYNSEKFDNSANFIIENFYKNPADFYEDIANFYREKGYLKVAHKQIAIFNHLYDFYIYKGFERVEEFVEYLKYDYLLMGKPGNFPAWYVERKDKELYTEKLKEIEFKTMREAYKNSEFQEFDFDVIEKKEGKINLLFIYKKGKVIDIRKC